MVAAAEIKIDVGDSGPASVTTTEPSPGARSDSGPRADDAGDDRRAGAASIASARG